MSERDEAAKILANAYAENENLGVDAAMCAALDALSAAGLRVVRERTVEEIARVLCAQHCAEMELDLNPEMTGMNPEDDTAPYWSLWVDDGTAVHTLVYGSRETEESA